MSKDDDSDATLPAEDAMKQAKANVNAATSAMVMGQIYQTAAQSVGMALQNAVATQNNQYMEDNVAATEGVSLVYAVPNMATSITTDGILKDTIAAHVDAAKELGEKP